MTITKVLPITTHTTESLVNMHLVDRSKLVRLPAAALPAKGSETSYQLVAGDKGHLSQIRVGDYPPSKAGAAYNKSAKVSTWRLTQNSETGEEVWTPITATVALSDAGGEGVHDATEIAALLSMAFTVFVPGGTGAGNDYNETALEASSYGVSDIIVVG